MADIRFLGRARGGRCVYCHDSLAGAVRTCPECSATWHADCGQGAARCPTIACSGPAPDATARPDPSAVLQGDTDRRRPSLDARSEVNRHLLRSALGNLVAVAITGSYLAWVALHWEKFWDFLVPAESGPGGPLGMTSLALAAVFLLFRANWLLRLPGVYREVSTLLDDTRPTAMRLNVRSMRQTDSELWFNTESWYATLDGDGTSLTFPLEGLLIPDWLKRFVVDRPVLVYGLPPPGPYVIEFPDGALALVHPD